MAQRRSTSSAGRCRPTIRTAPVYKERYFGHQDTSIRILLSDLAADITTLPTIDNTRTPVRLDGDWTAAPPNNGAGAYGPVDATHPPMPWSPGPSPAGVNATGTVTVAGSTYAAGLATIHVNNANGIPAYYRIPATLTVQPAVGPAINNIICTGRTIDTFTGCTPAPGVIIPVGATVTANVNSGWAGAFVATTTTRQASTVVNWSATAPVTTTIAVVSTASFAPDFMFVGGRAVTCPGYNAALNPPRFLFCEGLAAAPVGGETVTNGALTPTGTSTVGGFIKIERKNLAGVWGDITMEILNLGIGAPNQLGRPCGDPTPTAIIRLVRLRDNGRTGAGACGYASSLNPTDWWPQVLYDPREGNLRDQNAVTSMALSLGGVMHHVELDVTNLKLWLAGNIAGTGNQTYQNNGFIVYFSDRRNNRNALSAETGAYGYEDIVNPGSAAGAPNGGLPEQAEDVSSSIGGNPDNVLDVYGGMPNFQGVYNTVRAGSLAPLDVNARPLTQLEAGPARVNRALLFRRALKLVRGGIVAGVNGLPATGLTVVAENPVYVQGNYNATATNVTGASVPASVIGDAITILSNAWSDSDSFLAPNDPRAAPESIRATGLRRSPERAGRSTGRDGRRRPRHSSGRSSAPTAASETSCATSRTGTPPDARFSTRVHS